MAESFTGGSQAYAMARLDGTAGAHIVLQDASGNELAAFDCPKAFQAVVASAPGMAQGETCIISASGKTAEATPSAQAASASGRASA